MRSLGLVLTAFSTIVALAQSVAFAQYTPGDPTADPDRLVISEKRRRLEQDERNIENERAGLGEFELKAKKIRRQMEALALMAEEETSPRLQEFAAELRIELAKLETHVAGMKESLAIQQRILNESTRQLDAQEAEYKRRTPQPAGRTARSPAEEYLETMRQQTEQIITQEALRRQQEIEQQNQRLMDLDTHPPTSQLPPSPPSSVRPVQDAGADPAECAWCEMLQKKAAEKDYDIAEINLLAAKGLPGAENLDVDRALKTLDLWAAWVKHETDRNFHKFTDAPQEYSNSEAYFRVLLMICILQEDFRVCYNKDPKMRAGPVELIPNDFSFFANPRDLFVNGLTEAEHEGTCASLPVLYVAIGRRLGYPLRLVECKGHLFVRWEDAKERFNIEGTNRGLNCYPDEEYMEWPWPISKEELATGMYMKSLSPKRELAGFLESRALCLKQHGLEQRFATVKAYADGLRRKEGVDLDRLSEIVRASVQKHSADGGVGSALLFQTLTNTNSWRGPGNERGSHEKHTVFSSSRTDPK